MAHPAKRSLLQQAISRLKDLLGDITLETPSVGEDLGYDYVVRSGTQFFTLTFRSSAKAAPLAAAIRKLAGTPHREKGGTIPLLAVPFMGPVGEKLCEEAGVFWFDLSGNAHIMAPGLRIEIKGNPNSFKKAGRPESPFGPKASRIVRWLLMNPDHPITQRQLSAETGIDEGFTSRIVRKLEADLYLERNREGEVKPRDPRLLLDAWQSEYDFGKHKILRGHIAARSGEDLLTRLNSMLNAHRIDFACTALPAAWLYAPFSLFRLVTLYLRDPLPESALKEMAFRESTESSNVWLVYPNDEGVFYGSKRIKKITCVHPVQVYLDLKDHPERSKEAAEFLRSERLNWRKRRGPKA
jgi:hypothetical protein